MVTDKRIEYILLGKNKLKSLRPPGKAKVYLILLLCLVNISCIKQKNLFEEDNKNNGKGKEVVNETDFFYPFSSEAKDNTAIITIRTKNELPHNLNNIEVEIPPLKYNKSWLFMLTQDDCKQAAFSCTWAAINGKPLSAQYFYDLAHLQADDLPPDSYRLGKTLGSKDGTGREVRFSFTTTLSPEWEFMNVKSTIYKGFTGQYYRFFMKSGLVWGNVKEMLNYGVGIAFHDANTDNVSDEANILNHYGIAQNIILTKLLGRGCKMLAEPDGNKTYVQAAQAYPAIQTMTAQAGADKLYPYQENMNLEDILIERVFYDPPEEIKAAIAKELLQPEEQRAAIYVGVHGTDSQWAKFLLWLNDEYGKDGLDNVWVPNQEEYYEYNYYRTNGVISSPSRIDDHTLEFAVNMPSGQYFYYPSITVNLSGIKQEDIVSITSNDAVTGLSYGDFKNGIMLNIDCRKHLVEHAEHFVERYEATRSNVSNKADALYFVNMLKESDKKTDLLQRLK